MRGNLHLDVDHLTIGRGLKAGIGKRTTGTHYYRTKSRIVAAIFLLLLTAAFGAIPCTAQDWINTGTGLGMEKVRLAVPDFKPSTSDAKNADLLKVFNDTLWNDLDNAGIFDMVSKSFYPSGDSRHSGGREVSMPGMRHRRMRPCWPSAIWASPATT